MTAFSSYHPIVNMLYFTLVLCFACVFTHPVCLSISLVCALVYSICLKSGRAVRFTLLYMLPMFILTALLNPIFNHEGNTILAYLNDGNPLTLESILYGMAAGVMLICVVAWFSCFNEVMTADKFIYLFGRVIPSLSLILSMALRMIPRFKAQLKIISNAQRGIGRDISKGSLLKRAKHGIHILSVMITWALENAVETADSMKSRGYGLKGRTAFSIYRFDKRDVYALGYLLFCGLYIIIGAAFGGLYFRYFPTVGGVDFNILSLSMYITYFALCIMPVVINIISDYRWHLAKTRKGELSS